jgi:Zn-dependent protease
MHATSLILFVWVGVSHYLQRHRLADAGAGILFMLSLFAIVVLHELGHALTARHFGIRTREITRLPIGGVARMDRMPDASRPCTDRPLRTRTPPSWSGPCRARPSAPSPCGAASSSDRVS